MEERDEERGCLVPSSQGGMEGWRMRGKGGLSHLKIWVQAGNGLVRALSTQLMISLEEQVNLSRDYSKPANYCLTLNIAMRNLPSYFLCCVQGNKEEWGRLWSALLSLHSDWRKLPSLSFFKTLENNCQISLWMWLEVRIIAEENGMDFIEMTLYVIIKCIIFNTICTKL